MSELPAEISELQRRFDALNKRKIETETKLADKSKALDQLKADAKEKFGTDDPDQLQKLLAQQEAENLQKRRDYEALLNQIEAEILRIESEYGENP